MKNFYLTSLVIACICMTFQNKLTAQVVTTVAGNGTVGAPLILDSALKAPIGRPATVYVDKNKNIYYTDILNHQIRKIDSNGVSVTLAGNLSAGYSGDGGNALLASLNEPRSLVVTKKKEVIFCDHLNHCIRKIDSTGVITRFAGTTVQGFSGDGGQALLAQFNTPRGIVQDRLGNFYICDESNNKIRMIDTLGIVSTVMGSLPGYSGDGGSAVFAQLNRPTSLSIDQHDQLYITDANNYCVRKIDSVGIVSTIAGNGINFGFGGDGGNPQQASFLYISAVSVADNGDVVIADAGNNRVRRIRNNVVYTIAGNGLAGFSIDGTIASQAQFSVVAGITMDKKRNVYICDQGNNRIRRLDDYNKITVSINELDDDAPAIWCYKSMLNCNSPLAGKIELYTLDGKLVQSEHVKKGDNQFTLLTNTTIISFQFKADNGRLMSGKFLAD